MAVVLMVAITFPRSDVSVVPQADVIIISVSIMRRIPQAISTWRHESEREYLSS